MSFVVLLLRHHGSRASFRNSVHVSKPQIVHKVQLKYFCNQNCGHIRAVRILHIANGRLCPYTPNAGNNTQTEGSDVRTIPHFV